MKKEAGRRKCLTEGRSVTSRHCITGMKTEYSYAYRNKSGRNAPMWVVPQIIKDLSRVFVRARGFIVFKIFKARSDPLKTKE